MNTLSLFLGSSWQLASARKIAGDTVRLLTREYEPKGVRVKVLLWEDFHAEYCGVSKQEEYNTELVGKANLSFFLFKKEIGPFTARELDVAVQRDASKVFCACLPHPKRDDLRAILGRKGVSVADVADDEDFCTFLKAKVCEHIDQQGLCCEPMEMHKTAKQVYATIPQDMSCFHSEFGNMMRSVDDIVEEQMNMRCLLHDYRSIDLLKKTNYYVSLLNNKLTDSERNEIKEAFHLQAEGHIEAIATYVRSGQHKVKSGKKTHTVIYGRVLANEPEIKNLIYSKEAFKIGFQSLDRVKLNMLLWFYHQRKRIIGPNEPGFAVYDGVLHFFGHPIASCESVDSSSKIRNLAEEERRLCKRYSSIQEPEKECNLFLDVSSQLCQVRSQLLLIIIAEMNKMMLGVVDDSAFDASKYIDSDAWANAVEQEGKVLDEVNNQMKDVWVHRANHLAQRADYLRNHITEDNQDELIKVCRNRVRILERVYRSHLCEVDQLINAQVYLVAVNDAFTGIYDNDLYKAVYETADEARYGDPVVEAMRMNYANHLARQENYDEAMPLYELVLKKLLRMDDTTLMVRRQLTHVLTQLCNSYMELIPHGEQADKVLTVFEETTRRWLVEDPRFLMDRGIYIACAIKHLRINQFDDALLTDAEHTISLLSEQGFVQPSDHFYGDVFCFLPNMIACYYLDRVRVLDSNEERQKYLTETVRYTKNVLENSQQLISYDDSRGRFFLAQAYHQLGFVYAHSDASQWLKAVRCYEHALSLRKWLYDKTGNPADEPLKAETLLNMGDVLLSLYVSGNHDYKAQAVECARQSLRIYAAHQSSGNFGMELHLYQAKQLLGTIYYRYAKAQEPGFDLAEALNLLRECRDWDLAHSDNDYHHVFQSNCYRILEEEGM